MNPPPKFLFKAIPRSLDRNGAAYANLIDIIRAKEINPIIQGLDID